jgi:hypothetical protein
VEFKWKMCLKNQAQGGNGLFLRPQVFKVLDAGASCNAPHQPSPSQSVYKVVGEVDAASMGMAAIEKALIC